MRLQGNKILITGATSGIGEALLNKFLSYDNHIIAVGRNEDKLKELAKQDERIIPYTCDITKYNDLDNLVMFVGQKHPETNILINSAGIQYNYHFNQELQLLGKIEQEINTNLVAPIKLTALLIPTLNNNDNAAIVNISSGLALVPKMQAPVYCGTKAGVHIFSKSLRYQLKDVKVFEILPPVVDTQMTKNRTSRKISTQQLADEFISAFRKNKYEVSIGKVKLLRIINRISPAIADMIMSNMHVKHS